MSEDYTQFISDAGLVHEFMVATLIVCRKPQSDECVHVVAMPVALEAQFRIFDWIARERGLFKVAHATSPDFDGIPREARRGSKDVARSAVQAAERLDIWERVEDKATEMVGNAELLNKFKRD